MIYTRLIWFTNWTKNSHWPSCASPTRVSKTRVGVSTIIYVQQKSCAVIEHFTLANNLGIAFKVKFNLVTPKFEKKIGHFFLDSSKYHARWYLYYVFIGVGGGLKLIWWSLNLKYWFFLGAFINPFYHDYVIMEQLVSYCNLQ